MRPKGRAGHGEGPGDSPTSRCPTLKHVGGRTDTVTLAPPLDGPSECRPV